MRRRGARHGGGGRAGRRGGTEGVALAFARDRAGRLVPAAALTAASRRSLAPFTCPGCGDELVAHLGPIRARHFAHRPGSACPLTAPETALHFNAKERLLELSAQAFAGTRRVVLLTRCEACRRAEPRDLAALGDAAEAEGAVGALRADVLVRRAGAAALAIEVKVTHAVGPEKEAALTAAGVAAVEVDARADWEREGASGEAEVVCDRSLGLPPCRVCRTEARAEVDRARGGEAALIAELEAYRARGLLSAAPRTGVQAGSRRRVKSLKSRRQIGHDAPPDPEYFDAGRDADAPLSPAERQALTAAFRCPECGKTTLLLGERLARHPCPGQPPRPVAWRGYDGRLAELTWWKR